MNKGGSTTAIHRDVRFTQLKPICTLLARGVVGQVDQRSAQGSRAPAVVDDILPPDQDYAFKVVITIPGEVTIDNQKAARLLFNTVTDSSSTL